MKQPEEEEALAVQGQTESVSCPKCFATVKRGSEFCPECGATLASGDGSDMEVYQELARANLLRNRHQLQEAIDVALGVLRKYPNNATAHTLLGDIYNELDDWKQAAEWYEMALDLSPDSAADRLKLEKVREKLANQHSASTARALGIPQSGSHIYSYVAAVVVLVLIVAIAAFLMGQGSAAKKPIAQGKSTPITLGGIDVTSGAKPLDPGADPGSGTAPLRVVEVVADANALTILQTRSRLAQRVLSTVEDPRTNSILVTVQADGAELPESTAIVAAKEVMMHLVTYQSIVVRVVRARKVEFIGDTTPDAVSTAESKLGSAATLDVVAREAFRNIWFAPGADASPSQPGTQTDPNQQQQAQDPNAQSGSQQNGGSVTEPGQEQPAEPSQSPSSIPDPVSG